MHWQHGAPGWAWGILGLFTLLGVLLLCSALQKTLEYLRYGEIEMQLDGEPEAGKRFSGRLKLPGALRAARTVSAELRCTRSRWERREEDKVVKSDDTVWTGRADFPIDWIGRAGDVLLAFDIPPSAPPSDESEGSAPETGRSYYAWRLKVGADVPGVDLDREFEVWIHPGARVPDADALIAASAAAPAPRGAFARSQAETVRQSDKQLDAIPAGWKRFAEAVIGVAGAIAALWWFGLGDLVRGLFR